MTTFFERCLNFLIPLREISSHGLLGRRIGICATVVAALLIMWMRFPAGDRSLQPVAIRVAEEVANSSKPGR